MATLDHIGLNRYIYMSASVDDMTLGSFDMTEISNEHSQSILGSSLDDSRLILGINLYNNGPYGYSTWQQLRMSENPLSRHLRKNNQYPIVGNSKERVYYKGGKRYVVSDRYGSQFVLDEPSVISNYKPISLVGSVMDYNSVGVNFSLDVTKKVSMNNNIAYFTNKTINNIAGLVEKPDEVYDILKGYYLEEALNSAESPMSSFERLIFEQTIYPPQQYTYKSYTRARTVFNFNWNSDINNRQQQLSSTNDEFSIGLGNKSVWPLDVDPNWVNFSTPLIDNLGLNNWSSVASLADWHDGYETSSFGTLWNHRVGFAQNLEFLKTYSGPLQDFYVPLGFYNFVANSCLYSRRHTLVNKESVVAPSGRTELKKNQDLTTDTIFGGEAYWDVPRQSGKYPFYDSYAEYSDEMRRKAKDYTIIPEFRMSDHVPRFLSSSAFNTPDNIFDLTGSKIDINNSSQNNFYQIYSNSDFLKNFDIVLEDHKDFTDPSKVTLKCKAYKKLIPYDGFYPAQRTVEISKQFYNSYKDKITSTIYNDYLQSGSIAAAGTTGSYTINQTTIAGGNNPGVQNIMTPLFAPGVLFNSIKSGVAVDFPISSRPIEPYYDSDTSNYLITGSAFDKRIPFEALLEPEKYLANEKIYCNEPHPSGNLSCSSFWNGDGDELYSRVADNFLAEVPNFFLKGEKFTTIASAPQNDPNFGQVIKNPRVIISTPLTYTMRIKMYRSMDSANYPVNSQDPNLTMNYIPPQDIITSGRKETITMYSRPTSFGPPTYGNSQNSEISGTGWSSDKTPDLYSVPSAMVHLGSAYGFNYPFTPPYYHGQAWADITFKPTEFKKYTVSEILASSSVEYYRFDNAPYVSPDAPGTLAPSPQDVFNVNDNAVQLDASLNIFSKGTLGEIPQGVQQSLQNFNIQVDDQSQARWIIQPKFETPILNFIDQLSDRTLPNNASSASVPVGMWHQYGRIPTDTEGIYLQVTDIPKNWVMGRLGHDETTYNKTGSLADLCGFSQAPVKLGQINEKKKISECVVAIPFVEESGVKKFFKLNEKYVKNLIESNETSKDETLDDLVDKMKRFIFPPSFDFVNFPNQVDPVAMYAFEFSSYLSQQDLADIWQNVLPKIGREHEEATASISHSLVGKNKFINTKTLRDDLRWMVFKVKQRAASHYYDQVFMKKGTKLTDIATEITVDSAGPRSKIQYNWPYDFFSLVELVKIDASIEFSDVETDDNGNETVVPKVATEENAKIQLDTLFPKGKK